MCENRDHDIEQLSQQLESLQVSNSQLQATTSKVRVQSVIMINCECSFVCMLLDKGT